MNKLTKQAQIGIMNIIFNKKLLKGRFCMSENKSMSRKDFLKGMGTAAAGVAVAGTLGGLLTGCTNETASVSGDPMEAPEWPLKYQKIDPAVAEERAYNAYFEQGG